MQKITITFIFLLTTLMTFAQKKEILYVGTYTQKGEGIYVYEFDRKNMTYKEVQILQSKNSPSFIEFHPNKRFAYTANEAGNTISAYKVDQSSGKLSLINEKSSEGKAPCHIGLDPKGRFLYVSNYSSGQLAVYRLNADGSIGELTEAIQNQGTANQKPHMHSMIPSADGKFIYASDLGIDKIFVYSIDPKSGKLIPGAVPFVEVKSGDGPRHFAIHPNGNFAYSAGELNSVVNTFTIEKNNGALVPLERVSMLPADFTTKSYAADIHFSTDGKFLYASNRGHESLVVYSVNPKTGKLTLVGHSSTHGKHPRNFRIDQKGELIYIVNRDTDNLVISKRDAKTGLATFTGKEISIPTPVCVKQLFLE